MDKLQGSIMIQTWIIVWSMLFLVINKNIIFAVICILVFIFNAIHYKIKING